MRTLAISIHDPDNLGDQVCCPADYFELPGVERVDAWDLGAWVDDKEANLIFGGGGLVHGTLASAIGYVSRNERRKLVAWGLGHNVEGQAHIDYGDVLTGFDLVGVRDWNGRKPGWEYVPCASCMFDGFSYPSPPPDRSHIAYSHHNVPISLKRQPRPMPVWHNAVDKAEFWRVVDYLRTGHTVITNTYHGAYWAMLLGRQALIYEPFSSRFHGYKHQPPFVNSETWRFVEASGAPVGYLKECRTLNRGFYDKVKQTLGMDVGGSAGGGGYCGAAGGADAAAGDASEPPGQGYHPEELPVAQPEAGGLHERARERSEPDAGGDEQAVEVARKLDVKWKGEVA